MKHQFNLFQRSGVFYCEDTATGKQTSLRTRDRADAERLLHAKNEAVHQPAMNLQIAQVYLQHGDSALATRTWQEVMAQITATKTGSTQARWQTAIRDKALDGIRHRRLIETTPEHFLAALQAGRVATNVYLRRIHHYAVSLHWLPWPILPKHHWPAIRFQDKRALTWEEHQQIIARETDPAKRAYYELLWHLGGAQTDIATLTAEDIDWQQKTIAYCRQKTGAVSLVSFGAEVAAILKSLPATGPLFPTLAPIPCGRRARIFRRRVAGLGIHGVTLHSYRYAWAERAKEAGYPERFAMQALGHTSKAVHRAYAKRAHVTLPPLSDYEKPRTNTPVILPAMIPDVCRN
ncbi:MAG: tyrosine-type recombinase/integrase [Verrucomicrobiota bacterium]